MELLLVICIWIVVIIISLWLAKELFIATFSCIKTEKINERLFAVKTNFMNLVDIIDKNNINVNNIPQSFYFYGLNYIITSNKYL